MRASGPIYSAFVVLLVVLLGSDNVHSQRIKDNMYTPISGAHCFRRLNGTHVTGCSSKLGGSVGVLHFIRSEADIDFVVRKHPAPPYAPVLAPHLFTRENILRLRNQGGRHVSAVVLINNATELQQFSQESRCPNQFSRFAGREEETCDVERPEGSWNPWGTGLLLEDFPFPIYYVADPDEIDKLYDCFEKFNNFDLENQHKRSLCSIEVNAFMSAAVDTRVCLTRSTVFNSLTPVKFCDPLQGKNVFATLFPRTLVKPEERKVDPSERIILVSSRMDTTTMFDGIGLGAMDSLVPFTVLVSVAHFLAKVLPERVKPTDPNVLFMFFNGESYDYIGSQRFVYDLQKGAFPTKGGLTNPISMENIDLMIDLGTMDDLNKLKIYRASELPVADKIAQMFGRINSRFAFNISVDKAAPKEGLPPVSSHSFLRENASFPSVVITSVPGNRYYHSIYDDSENLKYTYGNHSTEHDFTQLEDLGQRNALFAEDSIQLRLRNVSSLVGMAIYELITGSKYDPRFGTNSVLIDEFLYCFLLSADCPLFHAAAKPDYPKAFPVPPVRYISVHSTLPSEASGWTHRILGLLVGQKVAQNTKADCQALHLPYNWYAGYSGLGECRWTTQNFTQALSPAFLDDSYDFKSHRYSTWTESTWREFSARIFLRPSAAHETLTLSIGFVVMVISFVLVFLINSRSEVLFNQSSATIPVANIWKERAKKWKANAYYWKKKYLALDKNPSVLKKLKSVFRKDQMDIVLGKVKKVRKWSNESLVEGLQTRFACGSGYNKIRQLPYVALPSYTCLLRKIESVHFDTGVLQEVFELLQHKVCTMSSSELDCGIVLDEMSIDEAVEYCSNNKKYFGTTTLPASEELATHALVFMLVGIHVRWKQIVAYEFTGNSIPKNCLKSVLDQLICKAEGIGLKVHFVTSDCGASNKAMWQDYGVSTKRNTIHSDLSIDHPCDATRKLEFIPDPVHVFKNAVNGWISNAVITLPSWYVEEKGLTSNEVNRNHLTKLVRIEQNQNLKMAHKLVEADVDFENTKTSKVDKMKVSNSTKYCNHSVAAALMVLSENGDQSLKSTSVFVEDLARWFDVIASRNSEDALDLKNISKYDSDIRHLNMMVKLVSEIKVGTDGHWKPWQAALIMATNAILRLQHVFLIDLGYEILYTSRFNQDCVENLFSIVRSKQRRPTPLQFKSHLRTITLSQYMFEVKNSSYQMDDREYLAGFMDHLKSIELQQSSTPDVSTYDADEILDFSKENVSNMAKKILANRSNGEANAIFHVAGYVMSKVSKNTCSHCVQDCVTPVPFHKTYGKFSNLMATGRKRSYCFASEKIFHFITCMDSIIVENFADQLTCNKSKMLVAERSLMSLPLEIPNCHNIKMKLVKKYLRFKMHCDRIRKIRKRKFDSRSMLS